MQRFASVILAAMLGLFLFSSCEKKQEERVYVDGTYTAEFAEYDTNGYKDFIIVEVKDGAVVRLEYDAVDAEGNYKTQDTAFGEEMEKQADTQPARYAGDLVNQYLEKGAIDAVDDVAGATWSSECFKTLFKALEEQMYAGDITPLVIDNVLQKK